MSDEIRDSQGTVISQEVIDRVCNVYGDAARMLVINLLATQSGFAFAGMTDNETGEMTGLVVVAIDPQNAELLLNKMRELGVKYEHDPNN